jgi:hypothetical protein
VIDSDRSEEALEDLVTVYDTLVAAVPTRWAP